MRDRLNLMPTWALLLILWAIWAATGFVMGALSGLDPRWNAGLAGGLGLIAAAAFTAGLKIRFRWENRALGDVSKDVRRLALRAAWKGPVPTDPEVRTAAIAVAEEQLRQMRRTRPILIVALALGLVAVTGSAITGSPWQLLYNLPYIFVLVATFAVAPRRLRKRLVLLAEPR